jgi:hypothetical protein
MPEQHSLISPHVPPTSWHWHWPFMQFQSQQSLDTSQLEPTLLQQSPEPYPSVTTNVHSPRSQQSSLVPQKPDSGPSFKEQPHSSWLQMEVTQSPSRKQGSPAPWVQ